MHGIAYGITLAPHCATLHHRITFTHHTHIYIHTQTHTQVACSTANLSKGVSSEREGELLTSSTHTQPWSSRSTSKPNSSNALGLLGIASCARHTVQKNGEMMFASPFSPQFSYANRFAASNVVFASMSNL
jgi:hypothetical protein